MTTSKSDAKLSSSQRFNDCLINLQEEFESNVTSMKSASARRFNIFLGNLKNEFELMSLEIETLGNEGDKYKAKVENVRPNICERCNHEIVNAPQNVVSPRATTTSFFKSRDKPSTSLVDQIQGTLTRRPATIFQMLRPVTLPIQSSQSVSHSRSPVSALRSEERWSITHNSDVEKELDVELAHTFGHNLTINCVKFSKDGKRLAVGCADERVYIYDVEAGGLTCVLGKLLSTDACIGGTVSFSGDGKYLATTARDGNTYIWEIKTKYVRNAFTGHSRHCLTLQFSPNGRLLLSASMDNTLRLWDMRDGTAKFFTEHNPTFIDSPCYSGADFGPDGEYVAASHRDGIVRIWGVRTGRLMRRVMSHSCGLDVKFMPDGKGLVSGGANWMGGDATLKSWDISSLDATRFHARLQTTNGLSVHVSEVDEQTKSERIFSGHERNITSLAVTPDGIWIASGSSDNSVRIWNTRNAAMKCILNNAHDRAHSVDFSPAGVHLVSGGRDGLVRIWKYTYTTRGDSQVRIGQ